MTIHFNDIPMEEFPHFKGGEKAFNAQMWFDGTTRIMHGILHPGASIGEHRHEGNCEIMFILKGEGTVIDDGISTPALAGQALYCPEGHTHSLINSGSEDLEFYACVPKQ